MSRNTWPRALRRARRPAPARAHRLLLYRRVLDGTLYDVLPHEFHEERTGGGEYIPLRMRRPSVRYALARVVVEDAVGLLFGEGMFPKLTSADAAVQAALGRLAAEMRLAQAMTPGPVDEHGRRFTVDVPVVGPTSSGVARTGWIIDPGSGILRLVTAFVR